MFAKLTIVVKMFWYILWTYIYIYIYILVYVVCGVVFRVVCCVVPLYLQASVTEGANIRAVMPMLKVAKVVAVKSAVATRKRSFSSSASEELAAQRYDAHQTACRESYTACSKCLGQLECHFKEFDGLIDVQA